VSCTIYLLHVHRKSNQTKRDEVHLARLSLHAVPPIQQRKPCVLILGTERATAAADCNEYAYGATVLDSRMANDYERNNPFPSNAPLEGAATTNMTTRYTDEEWTAIIDDVARHVHISQTPYSTPATSSAEFARTIDHTLLKLDATSKQIDALCAEARIAGFPRWPCHDNLLSRGRWCPCEA